MTPDVEPLIQYFACAHLPERLQVVSRPFADLALLLVQTLPRNPERSVALRKLLESKDCAVRAALTLTIVDTPTPPAEVGTPSGSDWRTRLFVDTDVASECGGRIYRAIWLYFDWDEDETNHEPHAAVRKKLIDVTMGDIAAIPTRDLRGIGNFGQKSFRRLRAALLDCQRAAAGL